jgi:hypothetical protein
VSPPNLEYFGVPNNEKESYTSHWISYFAENTPNNSLSIFVDKLLSELKAQKFSSGVLLFKFSKILT